MEENDVIEEVRGEPTSWISEMVLASKPNDPGEVRVTLDSKTINQAIRRERHSMGTIVDLAVDINGAKYKSKGGLKGGYHQIIIAQESRGITTFRSLNGLRR